MAPRHWIGFHAPFYQPTCPIFAVFTNQSTTVAWHLKPLMNLAFRMKAAASPSNLDGSSFGLLLLGTLSIHQKDGWWTSTLWSKSLWWGRPWMGYWTCLWQLPLWLNCCPQKSNTRLLASSACHSHLTRTMVNDSIWQIQWSPAKSFHRSRRQAWTWSSLMPDNWRLIKENSTYTCHAIFPRPVREN